MTPHPRRSRLALLTTALLLCVACAAGGLTPTPPEEEPANNTPVNNSPANNNPDVSCPRTACTIGQSICTSIAQVQACEDDGAGCGTYGEPIVCNEGEVCLDGRCATGCIDNDGDGHGNGCANGPDCDDSDFDKYVDRPESCDTKDNDCDGEIDEGDACAPSCENEACEPGTIECVGPSEVRECRPDNSGCGSWGPGTPCDNCINGTCANCVDNDGDQRGVGCPFGEDCDDTDADIFPNATERCDTKDNNCNGQTDEGNICASDCSNQPCRPGDRECTDATTIRECQPNANGCGAWSSPIACGSSCTIDRCDNCIDNDDDQRGANCALGSDCNDADPTTYSGAPELCDDADNNCDGTADEGFDVAANCTNGVGACMRSGIKVCSAGGFGTICSAIAGPAGTELCGDDIDNDCDGQVDEGSQEGASCTVGQGACRRTGTLSCNASGDGVTCSATPGASSEELCDGADNDCDGMTDEGGVCGTTSFTCPADDNLEPNNSSSAATPLAQGASLSAIMCGEGLSSNRDWFDLGNFNSGQSMSVRVEFDTPGCRMHLEIYQGSTNVTTSSPSTSAHTLTYTAGSTGVYKVWVYPNGNTSGACPYTIRNL